MKKGLFVGFLIGSLMYGLSWAATGTYGGRGRLNADPMYKHDGDGPGRLPFNVACSSFAWNTVVSASDISRSVFFETLNSTGTVCLSTTTTPTASCDNSFPGIVFLSTATFTDYSTGDWYCRSSIGQSGARMSGCRYTHSADQ